MLESGLHPTPKPIDLIKCLIELTTQAKSNSSGSFCGSGLPAAAKELNRQFIEWNKTQIDTHEDQAWSTNYYKFLKRDFFHILKDLTVKRQISSPCKHWLTTKKGHYYIFLKKINVL